MSILTRIRLTNWQESYELETYSWENFMKKPSIYAILLSFAGTFGASADTIVFDPGQAGADTISDFGFSTFTNLDLNQDGVDDIQLGIGGYFDVGGFVNALLDYRFMDGPPRPVGITSARISDGAYQGSFEAAYQEVYISSTNGVADLFEAGDVVGASSFGDDSGFEDLFGSTANNAIPTVGDSGYLGFRLDIGTSIYENLDGYLPRGFINVPDSVYAFLNVEHGSIIFGQAGFSNVAGAGAVIPGGNPTTPVPLPAGLPLLLAGLGAFALVKRRKA
ncbi:VPLPA-CTERM sorting domain-containing protein [Sulfitobacter sp. F26169L]|uniref:VPLPA-CTERM sorting domain-containing protein n=1 Tax=Sulfitobacter sp. F26169L TaxID=2996015 RepID=UPI002260B9AB|nr:VPLPA-CTERM sorting domain-containing protein [Sulfitobacter sp. F26169L]MCX7567495.1 VPLPA-CTERM sorting domain-containing protein [Sulfitobacter sp. F26169L]